MITEIKFYSDFIEVSGSMGTKRFKNDTDLGIDVEDDICIDGDYIIYSHRLFGNYLKLNVITEEIVELPQPQYVKSKRVEVVVNSHKWGVTFLYEDQMNDFNRVIDFLNAVSKEDKDDNLFICLLRRLNINIEKDSPGYIALDSMRQYITDMYDEYQLFYDTACDILNVESIDLFTEYREGRRM